MPKVLREVAGFVVLPVKLRTTVYPHEATHYIYIKPHEPRVADQDASRSLFLVNVPVCSSLAHIRHLFATQLSAGRVERLSFTDEEALSKQMSNVPAVHASKKRKKMTADELEADLVSFRLPETMPGRVRPSGSSVVAVFVDRPSMDMSLRAARKATKQNTEIVWGAGLSEEKTSPYGLIRYESHKKLQYPPRATLLRSVDIFMTAYGAVEQARSRENVRKRQAPDEDGFVMVTRGTKGGALRRDDAEELRAKHKDKEQRLEDFYRFQMREKRKEKQGELLRKFDEDKKKVTQMRLRRGQMQPET